MTTDKIVTIVFIVLALGAIGYLLMSYNSGSTMPSQTQMMSQNHMSDIENFSNNAPADMVTAGSRQMSNFEDKIYASESIDLIEQPMGLAMDTNNGLQLNQLPSECRPKDVLMAYELLPADANSQWAQVNPSGQGSLADQNFLTSGFHIGINTVGQTLRNANRQLRSEPLNPQVKVSPWQQTTIEPDINRRPLEISSGDL